MHRLIGLMAALLLVLGLGASVALAAEPSPHSDRLLVSVNGTAEVATGDHLDTLIVLDGDAVVRGDVRSVIVAGGTATLTGATVESLTVIHGTAVVGTGSTVSGEIRTLDGSISQEPGAVVAGPVRALDGDLAALGILLVPAFVLLFLGFGLIAVAAALVVAAFGSRQVRELETLIRREPGQVLVTGIVAAFVLPVVAVLAMLTIVGAPLGLATLLLVAPAVAFLGWIVAAIWVGDWIVARLRGTAESHRPYLAAVLGVVTLSVAGIVPFVSAIATLFGVGALLLAAWRTFRGDASPLGDARATQPAPSAA